jgi:hypothetical protein
MSESISTSVSESASVNDWVSSTERFSFPNQFLEGAAIFAKKAQKIEAEFDGQLEEELRIEHRALIASAIMQSAAALEAEAHEICKFGPGSHLGSNAIDPDDHRLLKPLTEFIDKQSTLDRFEIILAILQKTPIDRGRNPFQSADLLVGLRNHITHYKSAWTDELERVSLLTRLECLRLSPPPFTSKDQNFFPHRCLGAACGKWAVKSAAEFIDVFYQRLGIASRLNGSRVHTYLD